MISVKKVRADVLKLLKVEDITHTEFARWCDMNQPTLYKILYMGYAPKIETLNKILAGLSLFNGKRNN